VLGVGTRVRPYVIAGIVIAVLLSGAALWAAHHPVIAVRPIFGLRPQDWFYRFAGPGCAIGLALLVLAWVERNRTLVAVNLGYLAIVLVPINFGWVIARPSQWSFIPHLVIQGSALLLAGIGYTSAQRPARQLAR
jgi:hypothetical protein